MLITGLLAGVETGLNRVLRLDGTALPRLQALSGKVIAVQCVKARHWSCSSCPAATACNSPHSGTLRLTAP